MSYQHRNWVKVTTSYPKQAKKTNVKRHFLEIRCTDPRRVTMLVLHTDLWRTSCSVKVGILHKCGLMAGSVLLPKTTEQRDCLWERKLRFSNLRMPLLFPFQGKIPVVATVPERGTRLTQRHCAFIEQAEFPFSRRAATGAPIFDVDVSNS